MRSKNVLYKLALSVLQELKWHSSMYISPRNDGLKNDLNCSKKTWGCTGNVSFTVLHLELLYLWLWLDQMAWLFVALVALCFALFVLACCWLLATTT